MPYRFIINVILPFKSYDRVNDIYVIDFILFNIFSLWQWLCFYNACDFDSISIYVQALLYLCFTFCSDDLFSYTCIIFHNMSYLGEKRMSTYKIHVGIHNEWMKHLQWQWWHLKSYTE